MSPAIYCPDDSRRPRGLLWDKRGNSDSTTTPGPTTTTAATTTTATTTTTTLHTLTGRSVEDSTDWDPTGSSTRINSTHEDTTGTHSVTARLGNDGRTGEKTVTQCPEKVGDNNGLVIGNNGTTGLGTQLVSLNSKSNSVSSVNSVKEWNFIIKYMTAFTAAATAETVTYPLDLTKTRMQIQGEMSAGANILQRSTNLSTTGSPNSAIATAAKIVNTRSHNHNIGMLRTALGICRDEGPLNLWKGILPALYRHVIYSGIRMALYEKLRDDVMGKDANGVFPIWKAALAGLIVGGFAQFTASPMDLVKVQLQMEGRRRLEGMAPRVRNTQQALLLIYRQGGVKGLWKGWVPNVQRGALVNLGDLTTYDSAKRFLITNCGFDDDISVHVLSSLMAGFTAALMGTPADVIKTRVMNQPTNEHGQGIYYKSSIDCLRKTVGNEGFGALYKGFLPIWMRLGPWSLTFWVTFEWIRTFIGVGGF